MIPDWLIPSKAPEFRGTIRVHRINRKEDDSQDRHAKNVANGMLDKAATAKKHAEWKALYAKGKTPLEIAQMYDVYASTVARVTGGSQRYKNRTNRRIQVGDRVYQSQVEAMKKLHISRDKLLMWLETKRAKYV